MGVDAADRILVARARIRKDKSARDHRDARAATDCIAYSGSGPTTRCLSPSAIRWKPRGWRHPANSSKGRPMAKTKKSGAFDIDAQITVEQAVHALYAIRRLAIRVIDELGADDGDAESFCAAIREMSQLHGKALDDCGTRLSGHPGVGCFDKEARHG